VRLYLSKPTHCSTEEFPKINNCKTRVSPII